LTFGFPFANSSRESWMPVWSTFSSETTITTICKYHRGLRWLSCWRLSCWRLSGWRLSCWLLSTFKHHQAP
jgi:hypothetical protein